MPYVLRGTSKAAGAGEWAIQRVDAFDVNAMLNEGVKRSSMAMFVRVLSRLRRCMVEGRVYRLQREQRNIVCFELGPAVAPLITRDEIDWLRSRADGDSAPASAPPLAPARPTRGGLAPSAKALAANGQPRARQPGRGVARGPPSRQHRGGAGRLDDPAQQDSRATSSPAPSASGRASSGGAADSAGDGGGGSGGL